MYITINKGNNMKSIYEKASETAKKVRKALKAEFPKQKFSVTSKNYAGGSSVYVDWLDGPLSEKVREVTMQFSSSTFDGMIDLKETHGYEYEGQLYNGADYILTQRTISDAVREKLVKAYKNKMCRSEWADEPDYEILNRAQRMEARGDLEI